MCNGIYPYFWRNKSDSPFQCSDPFGVIVLEQYTVKDGPITGALYCFSLAFVGEDLQLAAACAGEREAWLGALRGASYECVRLQLLLLRSRLRSRQRESDPGLYRGPQREAGDPGGTSFLFRSLLLVASRKGPHRCSNPCFLATVGFLKKQACATTEVKLCVYDVRERLTATKSLLGEAVFTLGTLVQMPGCFLRLALVSPSYEGVGFVTVTARELEPELAPAAKAHVADHFWPTAERPRTYSLPATLPRRTPTPLHAQLRVAFDGLCSRTYRFHTGLGAELRVSEIMAESKLSFSFPQLLLNLWINEEKQLMETVTQLGELGPDWQGRQMVSLERHLHRMGSYSEALESLARHRGSHFKPSAAKGQRALQFAPVNMHLQRLWVHNTTSRKRCPFLGFLVSHPYGLRTPFPRVPVTPSLGLEGPSFPSISVSPIQPRDTPEQPVQRNPPCRREGQPSPLGPDRLSTAAQAVLSVEQLGDEVEAQVQRLLRLADLGDAPAMQAAVARIGDRARQLTTLCHPLLVEEALAVWESARADREPASANGQSARGQSPDRSDRRPPRLKSASLPRQFPLPAFPSSGGSASASDDSSSEDSSKEGAAETADRRDAGSVNGSVRSMDLRPTQLHKSDSMYSTDESRFSGLSEEFEPLDLTHLNIRASIMCMVSRVQHLANAGKEDPAPVLTPCSTPGDLSPWAAELMPSVRKLRQSMACLHKVARFTYALLSLK
ncbi:hypothetical protein HPB47_012207, partial [Ixodes persulcatus]